MGHLSAPSLFPRRAPKPWPRSCQRRWARPNDQASLVKLLEILPSLPRSQLARLTDRMIDRMDEFDGDPDVEDDDPADGSADDVGEIEPWHADGIAIARPQYSDDQSIGPSNARQAELDFRRTWNATFAKPS